MQNLCRLRHEEQVRLDSDCISALYAAMGDARAERFVCRAMEELAVLLASAQVAFEARNSMEMTNALYSLIALAQNVGMSSLARVALDLVDATRAGDPVAQAATLGRLVRIGDRSLTAVWDLRDMSV
jgi:DhnA family fructose-bisphosphate aldolase class Ia